MNDNNNEDMSVRAGIDLGSTMLRAAYVQPGRNPQSATPVPLNQQKIGMGFPVCERIPTNEMNVARFFPGLIQRLMPELEVGLRNQVVPYQDATSMILNGIVESIQSFTGKNSDSLLVAYPVWTRAESRDLLMRCADSVHPNASIASDVECLGAFFKKEHGAELEKATVMIISAGYSGCSLGIVRASGKGMRYLGVDGAEGLLAGNMMDFAIMQSALSAYSKDGILLKNKYSAVAGTSFQVDTDRAKIQLCSKDSVQLQIPAELVAGEVVRRPLIIYKEPFIAYVNHHLDMIKQRILSLLDDTGFGAENITHVVLSGGSLQLPGAQENISSLFGKADIHRVSSEGVAKGAAFIAAQADAAYESEVTHPVDSAPLFYPPIESQEGIAVLSHAPDADPQERVCSPEEPSAENPDLTLLNTTISAIKRQSRERAIEGLIKLKHAVDAELQALEVEGKHETAGADKEA